MDGSEIYAAIFPTVEEKAAAFDRIAKEYGR